MVPCWHTLRSESICRCLSLAFSIASSAGEAVKPCSGIDDSVPTALGSAAGFDPPLPSIASPATEVLLTNPPGLPSIEHSFAVVVLRLLRCRVFHEQRKRIVEFCSP